MAVIDEQIVEARKVLDRLLKRKATQRSSKTIKCAACDKATKIKDIDLISVNAYTQPSGCMDGDYWSHDEYNYVCPHCQMRNRFLFSGNFKIKWTERGNHSPELYFFREYYRLFKSKTEEYQHGRSYRFVNNYYVEKNLKRFIGDDKVKELERYYETY
jgi:glutaredoxin